MTHHTRRNLRESYLGRAKLQVLLIDREKLSEMDLEFLLADRGNVVQAPCTTYSIKLQSSVVHMGGKCRLLLANSRNNNGRTSLSMDLPTQGVRFM